MTRVIVDTGRASTLNSGLGQVVFRYAEALAQRPPSGFEFTFLLHRQMVPVFTEAFDLQALGFRIKIAGSLRRLAPALFSEGDIWHVLNPDSRSVPLRHPRIIVTVHDTRILAAKQGKSALKYRRQFQDMLSAAAGITAISHYSRQSTLEQLQLPQVPFVVIPNGITAPGHVEGRAALAPSTPFLLAIGLFDSKKRFHLLVEMMQYLPDMHLYIAGMNNNEYGDEIRTLIRRLQLEQRVHLLGPIDEDEKWRLYQDAAALAFPSEMEGFGLPALEAMAMGCPAILSRDAALPEVGGKYAQYFDVLEAPAMAETVKAALQQDNPAARQQRRIYARSFSWPQAVEQYISFYREISAQA